MHMPSTLTRSDADALPHYAAYHKSADWLCLYSIALPNTFHNALIGGHQEVVILCALHCQVIWKKFTF